MSFDNTKLGDFGDKENLPIEPTTEKQQKLTAQGPQSPHLSGSIRLPIKVIGERADRMLELLEKNIDLPDHELAIVKTALTSISVINQSSPEGVAKTLTHKLAQKISEESCQKVNEIMKRVVVPAAHKYELEQFHHLLQATLTSSPVRVSQQAGLEDRYMEGEPIPQYILEFDTTAKHTANVDGYLDVRVARKTRDTLRHVQQQPGKNVEVFVGPRKDLFHFYKKKGLTSCTRMKSWTSNEFFYFEDPQNPQHSKVVLFGAGNRSKLNHQLLQLKFLGIDMSRVRVRGTFQIYLATQLAELEREISQLDPLPSILFVGNRGLVMTELAAMLYPEEMIEIEDPREREERAENLLQDNGFRTIQIGNFKFSYASVETDAGPIGVMAMRMPNGSLAYDATRICCQNGLKQLITVGAGGSFGDYNAVLGSYQMISKTQYQEDSISFDAQNLLSVQFDAFKSHLIENISHVTVDSPLVETKNWLQGCKDEGINSVDVETFHIFRGIKEFGEDVKVLPGLFTSDILGGEESLEAKIDIANAWKHMGNFLRDVFLATPLKGAIPIGP